MATSSPTRRPRIPRAERRVHILDSAIRCMLKKGFHATSMESIAREAGINIRILYTFFASKEDVITAIVERDVETTRIDLADERESDRDSLIKHHADGIAGLIRRQHRDGKETLRLECYAEATRNLRIADIVRVGARAERDLTRDLFHRTLQRPVTEREMQARLDVLGVIFDGLLVQGLLSGPESHSDEAVEMLAAVLRPMMRNLFTGE